jgi:hypothetical protein
MSQAANTQEPAELSLGQRIFVICLGLLAVGLGFFILNTPLAEDFDTSGIGSVVQVFWNPIGAITPFLIGGLILLVALLPNNKKTNAKKPELGQSLEKSNAPRNTITALMPEGEIKLSSQALQDTIKHFYPDRNLNAEVIELPQSSPHKWLARARYGEVIVRLVGKPEPISQAKQQETLFHSSYPSAMLAPLYEHKAQIALQFERGSERPAEQLEALHIVASALLEQGLLGIADEQACNALPRLLIERNFQTRHLLEYKDMLPSEMYTGTEQKIMYDGSVWFSSRGFERFDLPNFVFQGNANELSIAHEIFNRILNYLYATDAKIDADHTAEFGEHYVKFFKPSEDEQHLVHGHTPTLIIRLEDPFDLGEAPAIRATRAESAPQAVAQPIPKPIIPANPPAAAPIPSRHKRLLPAELEWIHAHGLHALRLLSSFSGRNYSQAPSDIPDAMEIISDMVDALGKVKMGGYSAEQKEKIALQFGLLWGQQATQAYSFAWARPSAQSFIVYDDDSDDLDPIELLRDILLGEDEPIKASAMFNMSSPLRKSIELDIPSLRLDLN